MIKMVVTDIDGTVLNKEAECSLKVRNTIKKLIEKGIKVVLATGRMYRATYPVARDLGIKTPLICYQGGLIKNFAHNDDILYSIYTDEIKAKEVINYFREKDIHINLYVDDVLYVEKDDDYIKEYIDKRNIVYTVVDDLTAVKMNHLHKVLGIDKDTVKIEFITNELKEKYDNELYIIRSTPTFCEVSNTMASKSAALNFLMKYWQFDKSEVLAIGDQDNDIDMIEAAGIGVAMGNGTKNLKLKSDFVTKSIDEDGFSYAMEKFCDV